MPKPTEADRERFTELCNDIPGVVVKPMFGNLGAFVNDNMCAGLFGSDLGVRLSDAQREEALTESGAGPFGPPDRPMKAYVSLGSAWHDDDTAITWLERAVAHTASLPPKKKKT